MHVPVQEVVTLVVTVPLTSAASAFGLRFKGRRAQARGRKHYEAKNGSLASLLGTLDDDCRKAKQLREKITAAIVRAATEFKLAPQDIQKWCDLPLEEIRQIFKDNGLNPDS